MTVEQVGSNQNDEFPIGMRVLAVDDDPTCLFYLGTLLRRCQYHVTTTNQAAMALKMLRENKNRFDLVISDVVMPDMDGFQLLEIVGLEMDLPVIMLSGNDDTKLVMKGIAHGACDYLLKPVRLEELKNIWQHVIRRKKINVSDNQDKHHYENREGGGVGNSDQNAKLIKRRKDDDEDDDRDENTNDDDDDPSKPKKPRVVWSVELHRKFVEAVNQLGIDKAVPKKILDLMDVEKLTRENVASHLQKFRLYLKRISSVENQHANMAAAFGGANPSFLHSASIDGLGNFRNLVGRPQFTTNPSFGSYPPAGVFDRLNNPSGLNICGIPSTGMIQLGHEQNSNGFGTGHVKFQPGIISGNDNESILLGMPTSLEFDKLQRNKTPVSSVFPDARKTIDHNYIRSSACEEQFRDEKVNGNQHSVTVAALNSGYSPNLYNDSWLNATQSSGIQQNSYPLRDSGSEIALPIGNNDLSNCENLIYGTNGAFNEAGRTLGLSMDSNNSFYHNRSTGFNAIEHSNLLPIKDNEIDFSSRETQLNQKYNYALPQQRVQGGFISNNVGCLEDLVSAVVKQERGKGKNV